MNKVLCFKSRVGNVQIGQTTCRFRVICFFYKIIKLLKIIIFFGWIKIQPIKLRKRIENHHGNTLFYCHFFFYFGWEFWRLNLQYRITNYVFNMPLKWFQCYFLWFIFSFFYYSWQLLVCLELHVLTIMNWWARFYVYKMRTN